MHHRNTRRSGYRPWCTEWGTRPAVSRRHHQGPYLSAFWLPAAAHRRTLVVTSQGVVTMPGDDPSEIGLFDNEDVDVGEEAPGDDDFTDEELAGIAASQADPDTPDPDAEVS